MDVVAQGTGLAEETLRTLILYLPAYAANGTPVVVKGRRPIDGGRVFRDGRRILGDGKTWEGFLAGLAAGGVTGVLLAIILSDWSMVWLSLVAALSALLGDMAASFFKRRLGLPRGAPLPVLDQLDFFLAATIGLYLAGVDLKLVPVVVVAAVTYVLHRATNYLAYKAGLKNVPW